MSAPGSNLGPRRRPQSGIDGWCTSTQQGQASGRKSWGETMTSLAGRSSAPGAGDLPPSVRILTELRRRIAAGELPPNARVPSTRQITQEWGVAMATATKVLTTLRQEGLVRAV